MEKSVAFMRTQKAVICAQRAFQLLNLPLVTGSTYALWYVDCVLICSTYIVLTCCVGAWFRRRIIAR